MKKTNLRKWLLVILIGVAAGAIFKSMYLREVFYYPWNEFMGVNNTESGILMGWLGLVGVIAGAISGIITDRLDNTRLVLAFTCIPMGLATLWQATAPSLPVNYLIITILSFLGNGLFLVSIVRATRLVAGDDQGKLFGLLESTRGVSGSIVSFIAVAIFSVGVSAVNGIQNVLWFYGVLYLVLGVVLFFLLPKESKNKSDADAEAARKVSLQDVLFVMKTKEVWLAAFAVFATISCYQGTSYLVPYLTDAYGMDASQASIVGVIRAYLISIFAAPLSGIIADKVGSVARVMAWLFVCGAVGLGLFIVIPQNAEMLGVLLAVVILVGAVTFALRGIFYAQIDEMKVPARLTGTVSGIIMTVGFSPEIYIHVLFGYWLDAYKLQGYVYMFLTMALLFVAAVLTSLWFRRSVQKSNPFASIN